MLSSLELYLKVLLVFLELLVILRNQREKDGGTTTLAASTGLFVGRKLTYGFYELVFPTKEIPPLKPLQFQLNFEYSMNILVRIFRLGQARAEGEGGMRVRPQLESWGDFPPQNLKGTSPPLEGCYPLRIFEECPPSQNIGGRPHQNFYPTQLTRIRGQQKSFRLWHR